MLDWLCRQVLIRHKSRSSPTSHELHAVQQEALTQALSRGQEPAPVQKRPAGGDGAPKLDWIILGTLMNKLQLGSIPKTNRSMQNWQQPENLSNFIKVTVSYGMNPINLFEADKLPESGNLMQVPLSCPGQEGQDKVMQSGMDTGIKNSEKQG